MLPEKAWLYISALAKKQNIITPCRQIVDQSTYADKAIQSESSDCIN